MTTTTIEKVKKGDLFRLIGQQTVRVADGYNRMTRKYSFIKFDDICAFGEREKGTMVEIDFDF
jgi:hypothetical protein